MSNGFPTPGYSGQSPLPVNSPGYVASPNPSAGPGVGLGFPSSTFGPSSPLQPPPMSGRTYSAGAGPPMTPGVAPGTPNAYATFPSSLIGNGISIGAPPKRGSQIPKKDD